MDTGSFLLGVLFGAIVVGVIIGGIINNYYEGKLDRIIKCSCGKHLCRDCGKEVGETKYCPHCGRTIER